MRIVTASLVSILVAGSAVLAHADLQRIAINGVSDATVTKKDILLSDIASVEPSLAGDAAAGTYASEAQELRNLVIATSPEPGKMQVIKGQTIVDRLRTLGVKLETVAYTFPQETVVQRAGRKPTNEELYAATENYLQMQNSELELTAVSVNTKTKIFTEDIQYEGTRARQLRPGIMEVSLLARSPSGESMEIPVQASVNEWKDVAVAARPIKRGSVIEGEDVSHARVNMANLPGDTLADLMSLVGMVASKDIPAGDNFRSASLIVPSVVSQGSKVIITVKMGSLEARAEGTAMENGNRGQMIRVKNNVSNKVVQGTVKSDGEIEVTL